jgi:rhodanese-related sulfurtransferase
LLKKIRKIEGERCRDEQGNPRLVLLDFRASRLLRNKIGGDRYQVKTACPFVILQLDDMLHAEEVIRQLPRGAMIVCISETGNRDIYLQRYLYRHGFTNIYALKTGMRGWLKSGYPVEKIQASNE